MISQKKSTIVKIRSGETEREIGVTIRGVLCSKKKKKSVPN